MTTTKKKKAPARRGLKITKETMELVKEVAADQGLDQTAALAKLVNTGFSRMQALSRYAAKGR